MLSERIETTKDKNTSFISKQQATIEICCSALQNTRRNDTLKAKRLRTIIKEVEQLVRQKFRPSRAYPISQSAG